MKSNIKLVIVDDQMLVQQGMKKLFDAHSHIEVVYQASNGVDVINWFKENKGIQVDVVLMDIQMPGMDGWETTELLTRKFPNLKIIGLSSYDNEAFIDRFLKCGGRGYLLKVQDITEILDAIEQAVELGFYVSERVPMSKIQGFIDKKVIQNTFNTTDLTTQQIKIVQLICQEKTSQEIADILFLSKKTVETHRNHILERIKSKNMAGIVMYAVKHKLINFE
jgi:DNA-binding NarL/FixJ family response regulator